MRCPHCQNENEEGAALCEYCGEPFTAYAGQLTGEASEATFAKLRRLSYRPPVIPGATALLVLIALFGPFSAVLGRFASRTVTNAEGTNYAGAAFCAVGIALTALFMIPIGIAFLYLAWATWTRATWVWTVDMVVFIGAVLLALTGHLASLALLNLPLAVASIAALVFWFRQDTRDWFGA